MKRSKQLLHKLAAAMTVAASLGAASEASATGVSNLNNVVQNVSNSTSSIPNLISLFGYLGGSALGLAGIVKLKQHVDNPGQTAMKDGLGRLAAGGFMFCLPLVTSVMQGSLANGNANAANTSQMIISNTNSFTGTTP